MVNHFYTGDEFNDEHPRPGFRAQMKAPGSGGHQATIKQSRRTSNSPVKSMKRPRINHRMNTNKGHQVTLEDLFGEYYFR